MIHYPYMNLFLATLFSSSIMAMSSSHWIMVWMALELNMISFIPMMTSSSWLQESESALKYLLFQALGSAFILLGSINPTLAVVLIFGLTIKLGAAPFHFWFPSTMKGLPWTTAALLLTWQKIAPMMILMFSFSTFPRLLIILGLLGALAGGLGGISQSQLRPMLAYSSIGHMGWMISTAAFSSAIAFFYLITYIFISIPIMWSIALNNLHSVKKSNSPLKPFLSVMTLACILSLSGLPPFLGFFPKLISISSFTSLLIPITLIIGSLINLSYYLNFFFSLFLQQLNVKAFSKNQLLASPMLLTSFALLACLPAPMTLVFNSLI